jgi:hypothetical protein
LTPALAGAGAALLVLVTVAAPPAGRRAEPGDFETLPFVPRQYVCYRTSSPPSIDGRIDDAAWHAAPWTDVFVDIEGGSRPHPRFQTRAKMLWDQDYFYVAAEMEEPDIWGTLTERDSIIYHDNDFEVFIDPDGDTQMYYELEVNPLGTVFDLLLPRTYRDGGLPIIAWDIAGLRLAVHTRGTMNRPGDRDEGWTVEMAMPWKILREAAPQARLPRPGEQWRVNFSRVEWQALAKDGRYSRRTDPASGTLLPADNWVWSPQGAIDMHMPERWGYVQFSRVEAGAGTDRFADDPNEAMKWALRRLYYRQRQFRGANGRYADDLALLKAADVRVDGLDLALSMQATRDMYRIDAKAFGSAVAHIQHDGKVWLTR